MKTIKINITNSSTTRTAGVVIIALLSLITAGCSTDDVAPVIPTSNDDGENTVVIDGKTFVTQHGYMFDLGKALNNNSRNFVVDLSNGTYDGNYYSANTTTIVSIDFNSQSQSELSNGTYLMDQDTDIYGLPVQKPFTFSNAYAHVGLKYQNGNLVGGSRYDNLIGGSITVKKITSGYEIVYDLTFSGDFHANGKFSGKLVYFEI